MLRESNASSGIAEGVLLFVMSTATLVIKHLLRHRNAALESEILSLKAALEKETELRQSERSFRTTTQQQQRRALHAKLKESGYSFKPIGTMRSPFSDRRGTPRQPLLAPAAKGRICFDKHTIHADHFKELEEFSHVWVSQQTICLLNSKMKRCMECRLYGSSMKILMQIQTQYQRKLSLRDVAPRWVVYQPDHHIDRIQLDSL
jgi:hypothetical protein